MAFGQEVSTLCRWPYCGCSSSVRELTLERASPRSRWPRIFTCVVVGGLTAGGEGAYSWQWLILQDVAGTALVREVDTTSSQRSHIPCRFSSFRFHSSSQMLSPCEHFVSTKCKMELVNTTEDASGSKICLCGDYDVIKITTIPRCSFAKFSWWTWYVFATFPQVVMVENKHRKLCLYGACPSHSNALCLGVKAIPPHPLLVATRRAKCGITAALENFWKRSSCVRKQYSK